MHENVLVYPSYLAGKETRAQKGHGHERSRAASMSLKVPTEERQHARMR